MKILLDDETRNDIHEYFPALAEKKAFFQLAQTIRLPTLEDIDLQTDELDSLRWSKKWQVSLKTLQRLDDLEYAVNQPTHLGSSGFPSNVFLEPLIFLDDNLPSRPEKWDWKEKSKHFPLLGGTKEYHNGSMEEEKEEEEEEGEGEWDSCVNNDFAHSTVKTIAVQGRDRVEAAKIQYKLEVIQRLAKFKQPTPNQMINLTTLTDLKNRHLTEHYGKEIDPFAENVQTTFASPTSSSAATEKKQDNKAATPASSVNTRSMSASSANNDIFLPQRHLEEFQSLQRQYKSNKTTMAKKRINNGCRQTTKGCELDGRRRFKFD